MLEAKIERSVCDYARDKGLLVFKFTSPNRAAVPDRLFILPSGKVFFCEFKASGKKPTPAQSREHDRLIGHKVLVFIVDDIDEGKAIVNMMIAGAL